MASVNQATIIGFVGDDPKAITTKNNKTMTTLSIATTERGFTRQDGTTTEDKTDWHNIVLFGKAAEIVAKYVRKGASLYVQGKMRTRSYEGNDGITRYVTEIIGETVQLLDRRQEAQQVQQSTAQYSSQQDDDGVPF
ncbi:MAG: single-stranded DNA-binding protein [Lachnospiraceae bacterium]|nr:single-stranded DNA-binding protein [Lachnospiraceae bacterium]MCM1440984.1 single-stranded DNA-binding protein [Roseburia sp.]